MEASETTAPQVGASEGDSADVGASITSTPADGGNSGTQSAADTTTLGFAAERERYEQTQRALQSERDRLRAENERLKRSEQPANNDSSALTADEIRQMLRLERQIGAEVSRLRSDKAFEHADPRLYDQVDNYDSVESFRVAVEQSHRARKADYDKAFQAGIEAGKSQYGRSDTAGPADPGSTPVTGDPSIEQLAAMAPEDFNLVPQEVVDRVMRPAYR